jgi:hypothetical protein
MSVITGLDPLQVNRAVRRNQRELAPHSRVDADPDVIYFAPARCSAFRAALLKKKRQEL